MTDCHQYTPRWRQHQNYRHQIRHWYLLTRSTSWNSCFEMNDKEKSLKRCVNKTNLVKLGAIRPCSVEIIPFTLLDNKSQATHTHHRWYSLSAFLLLFFRLCACSSPLSSAIFSSICKFYHLKIVEWMSCCCCKRTRVQNKVKRRNAVTIERKQKATKLRKIRKIHLPLLATTA